MTEKYFKAACRDALLQIIITRGICVFGIIFESYKI